MLDVLGADVPAGQANATYHAYLGPLTLQSTHFEAGGASRSTSTTSAYGIEPSLDYFVTDHLSIGGRIGFEWEEYHSYDPSNAYAHTSYHGPGGGIAPRIGYTIPFTPTLGFWPRVSAGMLVQHEMNRYGSSTSVGEFVEGNFSLVARLAPHVLLELGPILTFESQSGYIGDAGFFSTLTSPIATQLNLAARSSFRVDF